MSLVFRQHETRFGRAYTPFQCVDTFDLADLLQKSAALDSDELELDHPCNDFEGRSNPNPKNIQGAITNLAGTKRPHDHGADAEPSSALTGAKYSRSDTSPGAPSSSSSGAAEHLPNQSSTSKSTKARSRAHASRRRLRDAQIIRDGHKPRPAIVTKFVEPANPIPTTLDIESLPAAYGGYSAKFGPKVGAGKKETLEGLLKKGYRLVKWEGSGSKPVVDKDRRIFASMIGRPPVADWADSCKRAFEAIQSEGKAASFRVQEKDHRRGKFPAVNVGVTYGKGTVRPVNLKRGAHSEMLSRLLSNKDIARIAAFGSASFRTWAPRTYQYYKDHLDRLWEKMPDLERPFLKSIFPCMAINFGPNAWTHKHRDALNCPFGWCLIHSLGTFDHEKGGHIILHEAKVVIEFPSGCTIAIPSATVTHSNLPVQEGDARASFTQFCAGGLFRYVDNGFRTEKEFEKEDPEGYSRACELKAERWLMGLNLFSTLDELVEQGAADVELPHR